MSEKNSSSAVSLMVEEVERGRNEDRFAFATGMIFYGGDGSPLKGTTQDVSYNGAFLATDCPPQGVTVGEMGTVEMTMQQATGHYTITIPCKVARVTAQGLGLSFEED